jgi:plastocyanin
MKTSLHATALSVVTIVTLLAFYPTVAIGTTVDVAVGNGGLFFSPSYVTIHPGDTVRWTFSSGGHSTTSGSPGMPNNLWDFWNSQPGSCLQPYIPKRWNLSLLLHTARRMLRW